MDAKINLDEKLALLDRPFVLGIVGYFNDYKLQVVMAVFADALGKHASHH